MNNEYRKKKEKNKNIKKPAMSAQYSLINAKEDKKTNIKKYDLINVFSLFLSK